MEVDLRWLGSTDLGLGSSSPVQSLLGLPPVHVIQASLAISVAFPNLGTAGLNVVLGGGVGGCFRSGVPLAD